MIKNNITNVFNEMIEIYYNLVEKSSEYNN